MKKKLKLILTVSTLLMCALVVFGCAKEYNDSKIKGEGYTHIIVFDCGEGAYFNSSSDTEYYYYYKMPAGSDGFKIAEPGKGVLEKTRPEKNGYFLEGWYLDKEFTQKWDFSADKATGGMTLYAKWLEDFRFEVYFTGEQGEKLLISENVAMGDSFNSASTVKRDGYTLLGYYKTAELDSVPDNEYDLSTPHTGTVVNGELSGQVVKIYTKWLDGVYTLVKSPRDLNSIQAGQNIYLLNDIDMAGQNWAGSYVNYAATFNGNGHKISNIAIEGPGLDTTQFGLFGGLNSKAVLKDVTFENITLKFNRATAQKIQYTGLLAGKIAEGAQFENAAITGKIEISFQPSQLSNLHLGLVGGDIELEITYTNENDIVGQIAGLNYDITYEFINVNFEGTLGTSGSKSSFKAKTASE